MTSINVDQLIDRVNHRLVSTSLVSSTEEEALGVLTRGIREGDSNSRRLGADMLGAELLTIASLVVSVCSLIVGLIPLFSGNAKKDEKMVLDAIIKETEDPAVVDDQRIQLVVEIAVRQANH